MATPSRSSPLSDAPSSALASTSQSDADSFRACRNKLVDLLSRRDYSVKELEQKLAKKNFSATLIQKTLEWARERQYLADPTELSERCAQQLLERGKGRFYIQQYLKKRGLPPVELIDKNVELHNALEFALSRARKSTGLDRAACEKIGRQLLTRGFPPDIVRTVIYEKLPRHKLDEEF